MSRLSQLWRSSTTRLIAIYGGYFLLWSCVLIGAVYWETTHYLARVVDEIVEQRARYLGSIDRARLPEALEATGALDLRGVMSLGVFAPDGRRIDGNIASAPADLADDGRIRPLPDGVERVGGRERQSARGLAMRLANGDLLVIARDTSVIDRVGVILRHALLWGLTLTVVPGLLGGLLLSRRPMRRVREIETAIAPIARGHLGLRLPVSARGDELDVLAAVVNRMLGEIEHLVGEVKGVCDSIAHDLRTPLTRLRSQLHRLQQSGDHCEDRPALIERCVGDVDALLARFRALLRISELEDLRRRSGFGEVDLAATLVAIDELYAPVAEDGGIDFRVAAAPPARVVADPQLLFEAVSNLVANAIRFTPAGGAVDVRVRNQEGHVCISVVDTGPGIPCGEREAVLQRYYRSERGGIDGSEAGNGLGLSIVAAIVRLHGFQLVIADNPGGGARITIRCWRETLGDAADFPATIAD